MFLPVDVSMVKLQLQLQLSRVVRRRINNSVETVTGGICLKPKLDGIDMQPRLGFKLETNKDESEWKGLMEVSPGNWDSQEPGRIEISTWMMAKNWFS